MFVRTKDDDASDDAEDDAFDARLIEMEKGVETTREEGGGGGGEDQGDILRGRDLLTVADWNL